MPSKAKLPSDEVASSLWEAIAISEDLIAELEDLAKNDDWVTWNLGGAAFGKPQFKGPGTYTAEEFIGYAKHLHGRLMAVQKSFEHRRNKEAERDARRLR